MKIKQEQTKRISSSLTWAMLFGSISISPVLSNEIVPSSENLCRKFPLNSKCQVSSRQVFGTKLDLGTRVEQKFKTENLCRKFPLNSLCDAERVPLAQETSYKIDRQNFCGKFPLNSQCKKPIIQVFKINLNRSGEDDERVKIEQQNNNVKLLHTTQVKDNLASTIINSGLELIPIPIPLPLPELNKYSWDDHSTIQVAFKSDRCKSKKCVITGKNSLTLPKGIDVYEGKFTIDYREEALERSVSFRVPKQVKAKSEETITVRFRN